MINDWTFKTDTVVKGFDAHVREQLPWYDHVHDAVTHILRNYVPIGGTILDFGGSTGQLIRSNLEMILDRDIGVCCIDNSRAMRDKYWATADELNLSKNVSVHDSLDDMDAQHMDEQFTAHNKFDAVTCILSLMFVPLRQRANIIERLIQYTARNGGVMIVVDKVLPRGGYSGSVLNRMTMAGKLKSGATPDQILRKELSLSGVQIPVDRSNFDEWVQFFQFGEFHGWFNEY